MGRRQAREAVVGPLRSVEPRLTRLQRLVLDGILGKDSSDGELVYEALLHRGFLVRRSDESDRIWLAHGYHPGDLSLLSSLMEVGAVTEEGVELVWRPGHVASFLGRLVGVRQQQRGFSFVDRRAGYWTRYRRMVWGHKVSVGPDPLGLHAGLDIGIALLVKVLPLVRVCSIWSCDGHAEQPARVRLATAWDSAWFDAVIGTLEVEFEGLSWSLTTEDVLEVAPRNYDDRGLKDWLSDLQFLARAWLDDGLIDSLGRARQRAMGAFEGPPSPAAFRERCRTELQLLDG